MMSLGHSETLEQMEFGSSNLLKRLVQLLISVLLFAPHAIWPGANGCCISNTCGPELASDS